MDWESGESFRPSRDKLEAVNRIAALTGTGPEDLGPGSKERKRVLVNLAAHIELAEAAGLTKVRLGAALAQALDARWDDRCFSTGQTITRVGLDRLLEAALRRGRSVVPQRANSSGDEAEAILAVLERRLPRLLSIKPAVLQMQASENPNWAQSEWAAFYFESLARSQCEGALGGGPPAPIGRCRFDIEIGFIWDFKTHVSRQSGASAAWVPLNDAVAIRYALERHGGLGFVVLEGEATLDDGPLRSWHDDLKRSAGKVVRSAASGNRRRLKSTFRPERLIALFIEDLGVLQQGLREGWVKEFQKGFRQITGHPRNAKFQLNLAALPPQVVRGERHLRLE